MSDERDPALDPRVGKILTPQEIEHSFSVPSLAVNKWNIQPISGGLRIAFGERAPNTTTDYWRVAITVSLFDATNLYKLLQHMVKSFEESQAEQGADSAARENV